MSFLARCNSRATSYSRFDTTDHKDVGVSDMVLLEEVSEKQFTENLKKRFQKGKIYTYLGPVVLSVNPYKDLELYTEEKVSEYRTRNPTELPPHIWAIADDAYRSMTAMNTDQCIIISGESGAGKTEASKLVMHYVACVAGQGNTIDKIEEQLLMTNPALEAFGNAKTLKNDNSSRFGKYMDMEFDYKGNAIGGIITSYLLEKSRVAMSITGERNFHIFYQLLNGAEPALLRLLGLQQDVKQYRLLSQNESYTADTIDDESAFGETMKALAIIGFTKEEIMSALKIVAAVLKLGNIDFQRVTRDDEAETCMLLNETECNEVQTLLACPDKMLRKAMLTRRIETPEETVVLELSAIQAGYARDALCKALYSRMFTWLVSRVNDNIKVEEDTRRKSIGVLDIYGFEVFDSNSFEQFVINYCNEKLQQVFIQLTLKEEQEDYIKEGIQWTHVDFFDNKIICDLLEERNNGILAILDDQCNIPGPVSDSTFLEKMNLLHGQHEYYESRHSKKTQSDKTLPYDSFRLRHYAGPVLYNVLGFVDKNNDLLLRDLSNALFSCDFPLLKQLFPEGDPELMNRKRPKTALFQFRLSMAELVTNLMSKNPNYIRCIKPNNSQSPVIFDEDLLVHQVRYLGLIEVLRIRRAGFVFRRTYKLFLERYKMLSTQTWPNWQYGAREGTETIISDINCSQEDVAFGNTKIFIKNPKTVFNLEDMRRIRVEQLATLIQAVFRAWRERRAFMRKREAQIVIAARAKGLIQRRRYHRMRWAALMITKYVRGWKVRTLARERQRQKKMDWAATIIRKYWIGWKVRTATRKKFKKYARPIIARCLQVYIRRRFLLKIRDNLPSESPIDKRWPSVGPTRFKNASKQLRAMHHKWRCQKHRAKFDQVEKSKMREKLAASTIFHDKKESYKRSVGKPFHGDYINLRKNASWMARASQLGDGHIIFADKVAKINRKNGKIRAVCLVMTTKSFLILNPKSLEPKFTVKVEDVLTMSLSPYGDNLVVFHYKETEGNVKGDLMIQSDRVIEIVAKMFLLGVNINQRAKIFIGDHFKAAMKGQTVNIVFKNDGSNNNNNNALRIYRKGNSIEIIRR